VTVPSFTVKGSAYDLVGMDVDALHSIRFTPNTSGQVLSIGGDLYRAEPVTVLLDPDGRMNAGAGVRLLAALDTLTDPLQWSVQVYGGTGFTRTAAKFWFDAADAGTTVWLGDLSPTPQVSPTGITRGPAGVDDVALVNGNALQFLFRGDAVGDPISLNAVAQVNWLTLSGKPAVIAAGATQAAARAAIGAGQSDLVIGLTSTTAKAGNYTPVFSEVVAALGYTPETAAGKNAPNGHAGLDGAGLVPASLLPSFVDDVIEFANIAAFPATGEAGKIYVARDTNKVFRWSGSTYVEISPSPGSTDSVAEGSVNLYYTDARAQAASANALAGKQPLNSVLTSLSGKASPTGQLVGTTDTQALTNKDLTGAGNVFPTFNQNTTGTAGTAARLSTARLISGVSFDGSADISLNNAGWLPVDYGWKAWTFDIALAITAGVATSGLLYLQAIKIPAATTISNVILNIVTAGSGLTSGQCFAGLYQGGTLLASSADQSAVWTSTGTKVMALSSTQNVSAGTIYVGWFSNGTTNPAMARIQNTNAGVNGGLAVGGWRFASANTGLTTALPASYSTQNATSNMPWAAVS